tara:strand:+ start:565 stop:1164 length:600 start_codon:yes stop_codon:yes gene_type:complete
MIKKFIIRKSPKFKGIKKLPAQKSPGSFVKVLDAEKVKASQRAILGDVPEYMGMSSRAIGDLAAESLAIRTANKKFFSSLSKGLKRSRAKTATGLRTIRQTKKVPKIAVFKAKSKGAMKAYKTANVKSADVFRKSMEKLTGRSKSDSMLMKSSKVKKSTFNNESLKTMGLDVREVSAMSGRTYKTYTETPKFNIFKKKK